MRRALLLFYLSLFIFLARAVYAQTPSITSFAASPSSGASGYPFALTWTLTDSNGAAVVLPCQDGIKAKNANTGSFLTCDQKTAFGGTSSGGVALNLTNVNGTTKSIAVKLVPKDLYNQYYDAASQTIYVSVSADPQPITKFTSSATTTTPRKSISVSWKADSANGVNLSIECNFSIRVSSPSYTDGSVMPCGKLIFSKPLAASGSLTLTFVNSSDNELPYKLVLFPAITSETYDGTHTASLTVNVASDYISDPVINSFTTSAGEIINSGEKFPISWSASYTNGVNLKISCADNLAATSSQNVTLALPCDKYAFSSPLPESSNLTLAFQNNASSQRLVTLRLVPAFKIQDGYRDLAAKGLTVTVRPKSQTTSLPVSASPAPAPPLPSVVPSGRDVGGSAPSSLTKTPKTPQAAPPPATPEVPSKRENLDELLQRLFPSKEPVNSTKEIETAPPRDIKIIQEMTVFKDAKLFNLFPVKLKIKVKIKADDGRVISAKFPWWSFLTKF